MRTVSIPVMLLALLTLLSACTGYRTSDVTPAPPRLLGVTTKSGAVLTFDSLPVPRVIGDTVYGSQGGVRYAIPGSEIAETRWMGRSSEPAASAPAAEHDRPAAGPPPALAAGAYVRIAAPSLGWSGKTGDVAAIVGDTLLLRSAGGLLGLILSPRRVPLNAVTRLEVSQNHGAHAGAVTALALLGMVGGGFAGYGLSGSCSPGLNGFGCELGRAFFAVPLGMAIGSGIGGLIGAAIVPERWAPVAPPGAHPGVVPLPGARLGLGVSLPL